MSLDALLRMFQSYAPESAEERAVCERFIAFISSEANCAERSLGVGHLTASAFIVNQRSDSIVLVHHRKLKRWLQPGGHADGDTDLKRVALKEATEETGLNGLRFASETIFDVDIHQIPQFKETPKHFHYDVRFLFFTEGELSEDLVASDESHAVCWCPISQLLRLGADESVLRMARKWCDVKYRKSLGVEREVTSEVNADVPKVRSFVGDITPELNRIDQAGHFTMDTVGEVTHCGEILPLVHLKPHNPSAPENMLIVAGIHGDEPAGVHAALRFAREVAPRYSSEFNFYIYPCLNPSGYELDTRANNAGVDLNRRYCEASKDVEVCGVLQSLGRGPSTYRCCIDLHEDNPFVHDERSSTCEIPVEYYFYESCVLGSLRISDKVAQKLKLQGIKLSQLPTIYGDTSMEGVIRYGEGSSNSSYEGLNMLDRWLLNSKTNISLQLEAPLGWPFEKRIRAHLLAIEAILEACKSSKKETFMGGEL